MLGPGTTAIGPDDLYAEWQRWAWAGGGWRGARSWGCGCRGIDCYGRGARRRGKDNRIRSCGEILQRPRSSRRSNNPRRSIDCFSHSVEAQLATCSVGLHTCMTTLLHMTIVVQKATCRKEQAPLSTSMSRSSISLRCPRGSGTAEQSEVLQSESVPSPNFVEAKVLYDDLILTMWLSGLTPGSSLA